MLVSQLIEQLQDMPQDAEVHFTYNYGDHWRTQVAPKARSVYMAPVEYSDYHRMPKLADEDYECEEEDESNVAVIIG
jgi:hypothetical protein